MSYGEDIMPRHAKLGNLARLLMVSVSALVVIAVGQSGAQGLNNKKDETLKQLRPPARQLTPLQRYDKSRYGMVFNQEDRTELERILEKLLKKERAEGHWGGPYQEYELYNRAKHLLAAERDANTLQNLMMAAPRKGGTDPLEERVRKESLYSYLFPKAVMATDKYMLEKANEIRPEYANMRDEQYALIMTSLPAKDEHLAKLAVIELMQAVGNAERRMEEAGVDVMGCEAECTQPERSLDEALKRQVREELDAQNEIFEKMENTIAQVDAIRNLYDTISEFRRSLVGGLARKGGEITQVNFNIQSDLARSQKTNDEVAAIVSGFVQSLRQLKAKQIKVIDLLERSATAMDALVIERQKLADWFTEEIRKQNSDGFTWLARALIYENPLLANFLISWSAPGTLKQELLNASAAEDVKRIERLMKIGADVGGDPGGWSTLAFAEGYGGKRGALTGSQLEGFSAKVQTPWDPISAPYGNSVAMLESQIDRVSSFFLQAKAKAESKEELVYYEKLLDYNRCRLDCLKRKKGSAGKIASQ
jgi:hypothetical protein